MRIKNSLLNIFTSLFGQLLSVILAFISRTIFIKYLGSEYLGINGLFSNVISLLSLTELGFGSAMVFAMYKPLAENDIPNIQAVMNLYKKIYRIMGLLILVMGFSIMPFLPYIIKLDVSLNVNYYTIFLMYLLNSVLSYLFFAYKSSIIIASQNQYVLKPYEYFINILGFLGQVLVLIIYKSYIMYLFINIIKGVCINIISALTADRLFPYINENNDEKLTRVENKKIWKDTFSLSLYRISGVVVTSTDNIIISTFLGISTLGVFSNYIYITSTVNYFLGTVFSAIVSSVGNLSVSADGDADNKYKVFKNILFINFWIYGFCFICLYYLLSPFITIWIGEQYLLSPMTVFLISIQFLIIGFENTTYLFRTGFGLFSKARYRPLADAAINLIVSLVLVNKIGVNGVILGTIISRLSTYFWVEPIVIYNNIFNKSSKEYFKLYFEFCMILLIITLMISSVFQFIDNNTVFSFILKITTCVSVTNFVIIMYYHNRSEFKYAINIVKQLVKVIKS